jgi:hypothetical protein
MSDQREPIYRPQAELAKEDARRARALSLVDAKRQPYARILAEQLRSCAICQEDAQPSAASAQCAGRFRRDFIPAMSQLFGRITDKSLTPVAITLVPTFGIHWPREMTAWSHSTFERQLKYRLGQVPRDLLLFAAGAWDISLNVDERRTSARQPYRTHYSVHLHAAGIASDRMELSRTLRRLFPSTDELVLRPVQVKPLNPSPYAFSYYVRDQFDRKLFTDRSRRPVRDRLRTDTRDELQRILIAIGRLRPEQRGFYFRCRGRYQADENYTISLIPGIQRKSQEYKGN